MDPWTLEEAQRWIGQSVIAKTAFTADAIAIAAEQQGTVIGVHGTPTAQGLPSLCLAVQFWPSEEDGLPSVLIVNHQKFHRYLCLSTTVVSAR